VCISTHSVILFVHFVTSSSSNRGSTSPGLPGFKSFFESQELVLDVIDTRVVLRKKVSRVSLQFLIFDIILLFIHCAEHSLSVSEKKLPETCLYNFIETTWLIMIVCRTCRYSIMQ